MAERAANAASSNGYDANLVKEFVDRRQRIQDEQDALGEDVKELFKEAKQKGLPVQALRKLIAENRSREKDKSKYDDLHDQVDALRHALGEFGNTPLGQATLAKAEATA